MLVWHGADEVMHRQWGHHHRDRYGQGFGDLTQLDIPRPSYGSYAVPLPCTSRTVPHSDMCVLCPSWLGFLHTVVRPNVCRSQSCSRSAVCHHRRCRCPVSDPLPLVSRLWYPIVSMLVKCVSLCAYLLRIRCATPKFLLCKFFESEVQITDWLLTRPVRGYESHDDAGHYKESNDYESSFHMISVPCIFPSMSAIAIALTNIPVMIHTISIISMPIFLVVLLWHSTWWSWSLLPYVYAQINADSDHYEPKCYVWTHTSTYGCEGRFWGTCIQWQKMGRTKFRCPWYFINHLVILYHQPTGPSQKNFSCQV